MKIVLLAFITWCLFYIAGKFGFKFFDFMKKRSRSVIGLTCVLLNGIGLVFLPAFTKAFGIGVTDELTIKVFLFLCMIIGLSNVVIEFWEVNKYVK